MIKDRNPFNQKLTQKDKDADKQAYYKEQLDLLDSKAFLRTNSFDGGSVSEYKKKKVNYELFNNKLNLSDFSYVCQPFGSEAGELPAEMANRDIISGKIKALIGMEAKRPFTWKVIATNEDATSRKEQESFGRIRDFVIAQIMQPIQQQIEMKYQEQIQGKKLSADQQQQIQAQIQQEIQSATPPEVMKYMAREYQDPAEVLSRQIMKYLMQKETIQDKFLKGFKHGCISGEEIYWVGLINDEPVMRVVNSLYFDHGKTPDQEFIEDSEWGALELRMTPSQVTSQFRQELEDDEIDYIYENYPMGSPSKFIDQENLFNFDDRENQDNTIRILYCEWVAQRKVGFLSAINEDGELDTIIVSEDYKFNEKAGDFEVDWQWIPEVHHGYKICLAEPIYVGMGPIPGQQKDLDNLNQTKLGFIGVCYDNMNSETTSLVDRMKAYQYYYNIIMYRIELLLASDKGKILFMNLNAVPKSSGIDLAKFQHFIEANKLAYYDPTEEGFKGTGNIGEIAKEVDMSLASDISKYIEMATYIEARCGDSVGITKPVEGQVGANEAVRNAQTNLVQGVNILEPYFQLHNQAKRNVLQALIETAKVGYAQGRPKKIAYVLDDMSTELLNLDSGALGLLDNSTFGVFIGDSTNDANAKMQVEQLAHAAMQNQQVDLLDVIKVLRSDDVQEAEELLEVATQKKQQEQSQSQNSQQQAQQQADAAQRQHEQEQWAHEEEMIRLKASLDKDTKVTIATIGAMAYDPNKDEDGDGEPDVLEVAKFGADAQIKMRKQALDEKKQADDNVNAKRKLDIEDKKVAVMKQKTVAAK